MYRLCVTENNVFKAHAVEIGTTNGTTTEITGSIKEGTEVLIDFNIMGGNEAEGQDQQARNPFMPKPRDNKKNNQKK